MGLLNNIIKIRSTTEGDYTVGESIDSSNHIIILPNNNPNFTKFFGSG